MYFICNFISLILKITILLEINFQIFFENIIFELLITIGFLLYINIIGYAFSIKYFIIK